MVNIDTDKLGPLVLDAIGRVGIPGIIAAALLYGGWRLAAALAQAHLSFLQSTQSVMEKQAAEEQRMSHVMGEIAKGQDQTNSNQGILIRNQEMILRHFIEQQKMQEIELRKRNGKTP